MASEQECRDFVKGKALELATYMETQGFTFDKTGSILLGIGAGWIAAHQGKPACYQALDMARYAIEKHGQAKN